MRSTFHHTRDALVESILPESNHERTIRHIQNIGQPVEQLAFRTMKNNNKKEKEIGSLGVGGRLP